MKLRSILTLEYLSVAALTGALMSYAIVCQWVTNSGAMLGPSYSPFDWYRKSLGVSTVSVHKPLDAGSSCDRLLNLMQHISVEHCWTKYVDELMEINSSNHAYFSECSILPPRILLVVFETHCLWVSSIGPCIITIHQPHIFSRAISLHDILPIPRPDVCQNRADVPIPPSRPTSNARWSTNTASHCEEASNMDKRYATTSSCFDSEI